MTVDRKKLLEVLKREFEATGGDMEAAVGAVATAVQAQLELPLGPSAPTSKPIELKITVQHLQPPARPRPALGLVDRAIRLVAEAFDMPVASIRSGRKWRREVEARWVLWAILHSRGLSLPACARAADLTNHTTVLHGLARLETRLDLQAVVARVEAQLGEGAAPAPASAAGPEVEAA